MKSFESLRAFIRGRCPRNEPRAPLGVCFALLLLLFSCFGCGGGSVGTGTGPGTKTFAGTLKTTDMRPLAGATVRIIITGEQTVSDELGQFSLSSSVSGTAVDFELVADSVSATFSVKNISADTTTVTMDVVVDEATQSVEVSNLEVTAEVGGDCGKSFENGLDIVQTRPIPDGTRCIMRVKINGDGAPLGKIPFKMERRGCAEDGKWRKIGESETGTGENAGEGRLGFYFYNDEAHCVYRVRAPFGVPGLKEVVYKVVTLQKLDFDGNPRDDGSSSEAIAPPEIGPAGDDSESMPQ